MRIARRGLVVLTLGAAVLAGIAAPALAGGGGHGGGPCAGSTEGTGVALQDSCLDGTSHFLPADAELVVRNLGAVAHDYVAVDGSFGTGLLQPGDHSRIPAPEPGVYRVRCTLHSSVAGGAGQGMTGVLVVGDGGAPQDAADANSDQDEGAVAAAGARAAGAEPAEASTAVPASMSQPVSVLGPAVLGLTALSLVLAALVAILARRLRHPG